MRLRLKRPALALVPSFIAMREACTTAGESPWAGREPLAHDDPYAYAALLNDRAAGRNLPEDWVPADTFWIVNEDEVVGQCDVRHRLTAQLRTVGGHIGYLVHPAHRGRGIATFALRECLAVAARLGIAEALLTCDNANIASIRVIEKCGGRRISDTSRRRYVIPTH
jgi:predicted acetyltransferase